MITESPLIQAAREFEEAALNRKNFYSTAAPQIACDIIKAAELLHSFNTTIHHSQLPHGETLTRAYDLIDQLKQLTLIRSSRHIEQAVLQCLHIDLDLFRAGHELHTQRIKALDTSPYS